MKTGIALIIVCYSFILTINILTSERDIGYKSKEVFIPPPENVRLLSFGFHESLADSLWLRWIQTPEACGKSRIKRSTFEENFEGYKAKNKGKVDLDLGFDRDQRKVCSKGWAFLMLNAISELAPKFRMVYVVGPTILSVLVDDHEGAAILYEKAIILFPNDWKIHYYAAYHYLFELDDLQRAAKLLRKAGDLGAPIWVKSLASKLYTRMGQAFLGIITLKEYAKLLKAVDNKEELKKVEKRIEILERQITETSSK